MAETASTRKERDAAIKEAYEASEDQTNIVQTIHREYLKLYGVKSAFFRFLREVLPEDMRQQLLSSIDRTISNYPRGSPRPSRQATEDEKEKYLLRRRNDYTHKVNFRPPMGEWFGGGHGSPVQDFGPTAQRHGQLLKLTVGRIFSKKLSGWVLLVIYLWPERANPHFGSSRWHGTSTIFPSGT